MKRELADAYLVDEGEAGEVGVEGAQTHLQGKVLSQDGSAEKAEAAEEEAAEGDSDADEMRADGEDVEGAGVADTCAGFIHVQRTTPAALRRGTYHR
jgi:hypothetical protein